MKTNLLKRIRNFTRQYVDNCDQVAMMGYVDMLNLARSIPDSRLGQYCDLTIKFAQARRNGVIL